ncbi:MAG TPA: DUF177 domain-containing protein [Elusimicrobiales bacterium]|nr:DUF177 domain-containing protein [Elusimicrobiales bacterium]
MKRPGPDYDIPEDLRFNYAHLKEAGGLICERKLEPVLFKDELESTGKLLAIKVRLQFSVGTNNIYMEGRLSGRIRWDCSRCGKSFEEKFSQDFEELYPAGTDLIDIMAQVRQSLVLANDISHLCSEECKGLCPRCGCNLNERQCGCDRTPPRNPFGVLKDKYGKKES